MDRKKNNLVISQGESLYSQNKSSQIASSKLIDCRLTSYLSSPTPLFLLPPHLLFLLSRHRPSFQVPFSPPCYPSVVAFWESSESALWNKRVNLTFIFFRELTDQELRVESNIWKLPVRKQEEKRNKISFSQSLPSKMLTLSLNLHT